MTDDPTCDPLQHKHTFTHTGQPRTLGADQSRRAGHALSAPLTSSRRGPHFGATPHIPKNRYPRHPQTPRRDLPRHAFSLLRHVLSLLRHASELPSHARSLPRHAPDLPSHPFQPPSHRPDLPPDARQPPAHAKTLPSKQEVAPHLSAKRSIDRQVVHSPSPLEELWIAWRLRCTCGIRLGPPLGSKHDLQTRPYIAGCI